MRVVCIDTGNLQVGCPPVIKGNMYTVIDTWIVNSFSPTKGFRAEDGLYYKLIETGAWYHESLFIPINENQQDEVEMMYQLNNPDQQ